MDIVDAQIHIGPGRIEERLAAMDAPGVRAAPIDEYWLGAGAGEPAYPGDGLRPILRQAIGRFGAERIMWASDAGASQTGENRAEPLFGMRGGPDLSQSEREALLGGTVRTWLDWPLSG